jgi:hypothetical protein
MAIGAPNFFDCGTAFCVGCSLCCLGSKINGLGAISEFVFVKLKSEFVFTSVPLEFFKF